MTAPLALHVRSGVSGSPWLDLTHRIRGGVMTTNQRGCESFTCRVDAPLAEAMRVYARPGLPHLEIDNGGDVVWAGRLEDVRFGADGYQLGFFGYRRALTDLPVTRLWSSTSVADWEPISNEESGSFQPDRYRIDTNNRLYIALVSGEVYDSDAIGALSFETPGGGSQDVVAVSFHYEMTVPADFILTLYSMDRDDPDTNAAEWSYTMPSSAGGAAVVSGDVSLSISAAARLAFALAYDTSGHTYGGETGDGYVKITRLRVKTAAGNVTADGIVEDLLSQVVALNTGQLRDITALIDAPGIDIMDAGYADALPAAIIDELAEDGDENGVVYEAQVWADRVLRFQPVGASARTWYADIANIDMDRTLDLLVNSAYSVYKDGYGRVRRTAVSADAGSVTRHGLTRRDYVRTRTTNDSEAEGARDNYLGEAAEVTPRASVVIGRLFNEQGYGIAPYLVRGGDVVVIRNLPAETPQLIVDRVRALRVARTQYDMDIGALTMNLELEIPDIPTMIFEATVAAQNALEVAEL